MIHTLLVGNYGTGDRGGIFAVPIGAGEQAPVRLAQADCPSYMVRGRNGVLYVVSEASTGKGSIAAYRVEAGGALTLLNQVQSAFGRFCHVMVDDSCRYLVAVSYRHSVVESYLLYPDGTIGNLASQHLHSGNGPRPQQEAAHPHYACLTPDEAVLLVCDLGCDAVFAYRPQPETGKLLPRYRLELPPGCGPRHMVFHPKEPFAYLVAELTSEVYTLEYTGNGLTVVDRQAIPEKPRWDAGASAIRISGDGRYLYAANRRDDTLSCYSLENPRLPAFVAQYDCGGQHPRDFQLVDDDRLLVCANQHANSLTFFARDAAQGTLQRLSPECGLFAPACVQIAL